MRSNYKRLGDYIREVKLKNTDDSISKLLGINIDKFFMPSVANIVGTDLSKYKVVKKNQFACNRMHVGRDERIPVAMSNRSEPFIVSPAYDVFEIIDENILIPEYLMMWFKRKEFDRNAWFYTDGDVRGGLRWNDFIDLKLPIPSIEKQKELVAEYQTIEHRIRLNNELCQKLEETAQTVYRHWFEDFEFPVIARSEAQQNDEAISTNQILQVAEHTAEYQERSELVAERSRWVVERRRSYKSSGGEMVYSEELGKEIPKGWKVGSIADLVTTQYGFTATADFLKGEYQFVRITDIVGKSINWNGVPYCEMPRQEFLKYELKKGDILVSRTGANVGFSKVLFNNPPKSVFASFLVRLKVKSKFFQNFVAVKVLSDDYKRFVLSISEGSAQPQANANILTKMELVIPDEKIAKTFNSYCDNIFTKVDILNKQNQKLEELKSLLLGKMAVER